MISPAEGVTWSNGLYLYLHIFVLRDALLKPDRQRAAIRLEPGTQLPLWFFPCDLDMPNAEVAVSWYQKEC